MEMMMVERVRQEAYHGHSVREASRKRHQSPGLVSELEKFLREMQIWRQQPKHRDSAIAGVTDELMPGFDGGGVLETRDIADEDDQLATDINLLSVERMQNSRGLSMTGAVQEEDVARQEVVENEPIYVNQCKEGAFSETMKNFKAWTMERKIKSQKKKREKAARKEQKQRFETWLSEMNRFCNIMQEPKTGNKPNTLIACHPSRRFRLDMERMQVKQDLEGLACRLEGKLTGKSRGSWNDILRRKNFSCVCTHCSERAQRRRKWLERNSPNALQDVEEEPWHEFGNPITIPIVPESEDEDEDADVDGYAVVYQAQPS